LKSYRIVFAGTPDFAATALAALLDSHHHVVAVYTQPDRAAGRGQKMLESPVKQLALKHAIPVEQPVHFKDYAEIEKLASYDADLMIVAAYGIILPLAVLQVPKVACLNIHASLLPRWRGAAPIQRAIIAGDKKTGITIMLMAEGLDTGDMLLYRETSINSDDTGSTLHDRLAALGQDALLDCLSDLDVYLHQRCPQNNEQACYAKKLSKNEACINWQTSAQDIDCSIRAFNAWPVAFSTLDKTTIRIWQCSFVIESHRFTPGEICSHRDKKIGVACLNGIVFLEKIQMPGKNIVTSSEILNAKQEFFAIGKCFEN